MVTHRKHTMILMTHGDTCSNLVKKVICLQSHISRLSEPKSIHFICKDDKDSREIHRQASQYE
jgi:hypothetical protein